MYDMSASGRNTCECSGINTVCSVDVLNKRSRFNCLFYYCYPCFIINYQQLKMQTETMVMVIQDYWGKNDILRLCGISLNRIILQHHSVMLVLLDLRSVLL